MGVWLWQTRPGIQAVGWGHSFCISGSICWHVGFTVSKQLQRWWERQKYTSRLGSPWKSGRTFTDECRITDYPNLFWSFLHYSLLGIYCVFWICFPEKLICLYPSTYKSNMHIYPQILITHAHMHDFAHQGHRSSKTPYCIDFSQTGNSFA